MKKEKDAMLFIGPIKETVIEARKSIIEIIKSQCGDEVKVEALKAFSDVCRVEGATVSHCVFNNDFED
jgi:hypothetical protein